jgi:uncharacterized protein YqgC (DUF456 family)
MRWLALTCWVAAIVCFLLGTVGGRPSVLPVIPSLVVIYIVSVAHLKKKRTQREN